jgi:hypothetical protein
VSEVQSSFVVCDGVQGAAAWRSCDDGATWAQDALDSFPFGLLFTDIDCQNAGPRAGCWATLWDDGGIDPNGFVARWAEA